MDPEGLPGPPVQPRRRRMLWLVAAGLLLALGLGVGTLVGALTTTSAQAAAATSNQSNVNTGATTLQAPYFPTASTPGAQGPCISVTVTSVSGNTIVGKTSDGSSLTINTSTSTQYRKVGQAASASAVTVGSQMSVMGTRESNGSITATSIDIR